MKNLKAMFALSFAVLALSACGSNSATPATTIANSCANGMTLNAQFNSCCPVGQPSYSNQGCVAPITAYNNGYNTGGTYNPNCPNACPTGQGYTQSYGCQPLVQNNPYYANYNGTTVPVVQQAACNTGYNNGYNTGYNTGINNGYNTGTGVCNYPMVSTQMGCMAQGSAVGCSNGQIMYNGVCRNLMNSYNTGFQFYFSW